MSETLQPFFVSVGTAVDHVFRNLLEGTSDVGLDASGGSRVNLLAFRRMFDGK